VCTSVVMLCAMTSPESIGSSMDTGMSAALEAVLARHPGVTIRQNPETGRWEAIEFPSETSEGLTHAPTLAELDAKLSGETP
jgi:hypothetical protein